LVPQTVKLFDRNKPGHVKLALYVNRVANFVDFLYVFRRQVTDNQLVCQVFEPVKETVDIVLGKLEFKTIFDSNVKILLIETNPKLDTAVCV
jgi:hypothetical protein